MQRSRILLLGTFFPWPMTNGGASQRMALLQSALRQLGEVDIGVLALPDVLAEMKHQPGREEAGVVVEVEIPPFQPKGPWKWFARLPLGWLARYFGRLATVHGYYQSVPEFVAWLNRSLEANRYDMIVAWNLRCAVMAGLPELPKSVPCVLDVDDVDWHTSLSRAHVHDADSRRRLWMGRFVSWETRRIALRLIKRFDRTWVCSEEDREEINLSGMTTLVNIPFRLPEHPAIVPCRASSPENREILVVGSLNWIRNIDGVDHFLRHCWSLIREQVPDSTLRLVGRVDSEARSRWESLEGVRVEGFVEDLHPVYEGCAFALGLVRWGAGTKIKVVEALAHRRTCVVTPHTLRGYGHDFVPEESLLCGATDQDMVDACVRLLLDPALRERLAQRGHDIAASRYSTERFHEVVRATCAPLLDDAKRP